MKLWLVGMMGSGKSEVGRLTSSRLGIDFVDTDLAIAEDQGRTVRQIWEQDGEEHFRVLESNVIARIASEGGSRIVATGGGAVMQSANRDAMRSSGRVVWLQATSPVLATRLTEDEGRPLLKGSEALEDQISRLLEIRTPTYQDLADAVVDAEIGDSVTVAKMVEKLWNRFQSD